MLVLVLVLVQLHTLLVGHEVRCTQTSARSGARLKRRGMSPAWLSSARSSGAQLWIVLCTAVEAAVCSSQADAAVASSHVARTAGMAALKAAVPPWAPSKRWDAPFREMLDTVTTAPTKLSVAQLRQACLNLGERKTGELTLQEQLACPHVR